MARTFFALEIPPRLRERLAEETARLKVTGADVAWVRPEKFHATLRFVGEVEDLEILPLGRLLRDVAKAAGGPLSLVCRGLGGFPEFENPRVLWAGVVGESEADEQRLQQIRRELNDGVRKLGMRPEKGEFHAHVTLGRVKSPHHVPALVDRMGPGRRREFGHFSVTSLVLFESHESAFGTEYTALDRVALDAGRARGGPAAPVSTVPPSP